LKLHAFRLLIVLLKTFFSSKRKLPVSNVGLAVDYLLLASLHMV